MKAMILAAGRGERMRPLTDAIPKPLLTVGGRSLIGWQVERLVAGGFTELVINLSWLGEQIEAELGDGSGFGASICYTHELEPLETLGGIVHALPILADGKYRSNGIKSRLEPFALVSADIYTDFDYRRLAPLIEAIGADYPKHAAHLVLTDNPDFHHDGDMGLIDGKITLDIPQELPSHAVRLTYANIGVFHPDLFTGLKPGEKIPLFPWVYRFTREGRISGEHFSGVWENVGSVPQLVELDRRQSVSLSSR
jgi:MurNAc alpha-1-phosphate uridylyltransferase